MAPKISEEEIDDLIFLARSGDDTELTDMLNQLTTRENVATAEILEAACEAPAEEGGSGATCLHMAAANGHAKTVTSILSHLPVQSSKPSASSSSSSEEEKESSSPTPTPSSSSSPSSSPPSSSYIDKPNSYGNTALHWACLGGHLDTVKLLLSRGASPTVANAKDQIPLDLAAFNQHMHVVEYFLAQSKDIEGDNASKGGALEGEGGVAKVEIEDGGEEEGEGEGEKKS